MGRTLLLGEASGLPGEHRIITGERGLGKSPLIPFLQVSQSPAPLSALLANPGPRLFLLETHRKDSSSSEAPSGLMRSKYFLTACHFEDLSLPRPAVLGPPRSSLTTNGYALCDPGWGSPALAVWGLPPSWLSESHWPQ